MDRRIFLGTLLLPSLVKADVIFHDPITVVDVKKKPQIWMFSTCESCRLQAMNEIAAEKDTLDFEVVHKNEKPPARLGVYDDPTFWWSKDTDLPTESKQSTKVMGGWHSLKHLKTEFSKSRDGVKTQQARSPAKVPFVQKPDVIIRPDQQDSRAVAHVNMVYNPSHNCPSCGQAQYKIKRGDDAGPNHIHRCNSCSTAWYHRDS